MASGTGGPATPTRGLIQSRSCESASTTTAARCVTQSTQHCGTSTVVHAPLEASELQRPHRDRHLEPSLEGCVRTQGLLPGLQDKRRRNELAGTSHDRGGGSDRPGRLKLLMRLRRWHIRLFCSSCVSCIGRLLSPAMSGLLVRALRLLASGLFWCRGNHLLEKPDYGLTLG